MDKKIPTTIFTGGLGAGKTTVILNLIKQLPKNYSVVWLKNEYGDVNIDSELAKLQNIQTQEVLNGCICCVLIGRLEDALKEVVKKYSPNRLIIETAGTAYPYPIIQRINSVDKLKVDGVVSVIDALNYKAYLEEDYLTKMQATFVDVVIVNKLSLTNDQQAYEVIEYVKGIYTKSQVVISLDGNISKDILLGIDKNLISSADDHAHDVHTDKIENAHHADEVEVFTHEFKKDSNISIDKLKILLEALPSKKYFRIKGIVNSKQLGFLINYVLGRLDIQELSGYVGDSKLTFMGKLILDQKDAIIMQLEEMYE